MGGGARAMEDERAGARVGARVGDSARLGSVFRVAGMALVATGMARQSRSVLPTGLAEVAQLETAVNLAKPQWRTPPRDHAAAQAFSIECQLCCMILRS